MPSRPAHGDDAGLTLVELLVAMVLFTLLLGATGAFALTLSRSQRTTEVRGDRVQQATSALATFDRQIRSGNVLYTPAAPVAATTVAGEIQRLRVYTQANGLQKCVEWRLYGTSSKLQLQSRSWDPEWRISGQVADWQAAAHDLAATSLAPFSTENANRKVVLRLTVQPPQGESKPVEVQTSVTGRNTEYGYNTQACSDVPA